MLRRLAAVFLSLFSIPIAIASQPGMQTARHVSLTPAVVVAGSPELVRVHAPGASGAAGEWLGHKVVFFKASGGDWDALVGVDVEAPVGESTLHMTLQEPSGDRELEESVEIHAAHYRTGVLTVAPRFVSPNPEEMREIEAEIELKAEVFAHSAPEPLWHGSFRAPVPLRATASFGTRRMFNGELASIHKGTDFHAAMGTPIRAANGGVVVLARKLFYEGNIVVIDHGLGLYTLSMHLSRIDVREGERVHTGQLLGLSGATGRVTGPHLHWAVRWENAYLDPVKLLKMNLTNLP